MTPLLSVEAFQASAMLLFVAVVIRRLPGAVGGSVSSSAGGVLAVTSLLDCDTLPAASLAKTVQK